MANLHGMAPPIPLLLSQGDIDAIKATAMAPPIPLLLSQEDIDAIKATARPGNEVLARDAHDRA